MSECYLSGRGQGHVSNFCIVDLDPQLVRGRLVYDTCKLCRVLRRDLSIKMRLRAKSLAGDPDNQRQRAAAKKAGRNV